MLRKRPALIWLLAGLPLVTRIGLDVVDGASRPGPWLLIALPVVVLLGVVGWAHGSRAPLAVQLEKELSLHGPLALATVAAGGALGCLHFLGLNVFGFMLCAGGAFFAANRSLALEREAHTLGPWLLQPRSRTALVGLKFAALTLLLSSLAAEAALAIAAPPRLDGLWSANSASNVLAGLLLISTGLALLYGPLSGLPEAQLKGSPWLPLVGVASVPAAALLHDALFVPALYFWGLVCVVATFRVVRHLDPFSAGELEPRLRNFSLGLRGPLGQLVQKELRLQRGTFTLGAAMVLSWTVWLSVDTLVPVVHQPAITPPAAILGLLWSLSICSAMVAGATAFAEERTLGTLLDQEALVPRRLIFSAKAAVSLLVSCVVSALLPMALLSIAPGWPVVAQEFHSAHVPELGSLLVVWVGATSAFVGVGLVASVVQIDTRRAVVVAMGLAGAGAALLIGATVSVGVWVLSSNQSGLNLRSICPDAVVFSSATFAVAQAMGNFLLEAPLFLMVAVAVAAGRSLWLGSARVKPLVAAALVLLLGTGASQLASQHLKSLTSHAELCGTVQR